MSGTKCWLEDFGSQFPGIVRPCNNVFHVILMSCRWKETSCWQVITWWKMFPNDVSVSLSSHSMSCLLLLHRAHFLLLCPELRNCQPTMELQTIKRRRMSKITSLLYSVESPAPRSCLLAIHALSSWEWRCDCLCSPGVDMQSWKAGKM